MSELHTVNKSPFEKSSCGSCLGHVATGSSVLFYEDGVYAVTKGTTLEGSLKSAAGIKLYALGPDLKARGIAADRVMDGVELVDYAGFVDLAAGHDKVVAWV
jgi:tRNA 2-thiouridine synthesizing protein B